MRNIITLKIGQSTDINTRLVLVAITSEGVKLAPAEPHETDPQVLEEYRADNQRSRRWRGKRLTRRDDQRNTLRDN